jgi:hypothetical protein
MLIGVPEMDAAEAAPAFSRLRAAMIAELDLPLEIDLTVYEGQGAGALLTAA